MAARFVESGLERAHLVQIGIGTDIVVPYQPCTGDQEVIMEPLVIGRRGIAVTGHGQCILILAADAPFTRHQFTVLTHR